jgi:sarcosine oxidase subunit gamma
MPETLLDRPDIARLIAAPPLARFILRADPVEAAVEAAYALNFPAAINRATSKGGRGQPGARVAIRLGPDEYLLIVPETEGEDVRAALQDAATAPNSLVDVSHRQVGYVLEGPRAADILNAGCPLDLGEAAFPVGMATRTLFHKAEIMLWRMGPGLFRLEIARSLAPYFTALINDAAQDHF